MRILSYVLLAGVGLLAARDAAGHHALTAEFDASKKITLQGTIVMMEWVNPHGWLTIDVKGKDGKPERWALEFGPPNALMRRGWRKSSLPPGQEVTVTCYPAKDGRKAANAQEVKLPDGRTLMASTSGSGTTKPNDPNTPAGK